MSSNSIIDLITESQDVTLTLARTSSTTATLTWTLPQAGLTPLAYDGCIILVSTSPINAQSQPVNGSLYTASYDLSNPISTIGGAQVVASIYGSLGNDITVSQAGITNLAPNTVYYCTIYICDNVLNYAPGGVKSYIADVNQTSFNTEPFTGSLPYSYSPPTNPTLGQVYYNPSNNLVYMWQGASWLQVTPSAITTGPVFPTYTAYDGDPLNIINDLNAEEQLDFVNNQIVIPNIPLLAGTFFFRTTDNQLYIYDGSSWIIANTAQQGIPHYEQVPIGDTGKDEPRIQLIADIKNQLGWPRVCVELDDSQFNNAVNLALREARRRLDSAYHLRNMLFVIHPNQPDYYLNDPTDDTDKIVNIVKIHRMTQFGVNAIGGDNGVYSQTFFNQVFMGGQMVDILSIHLIAQLGEEYTRIFAGDLQYVWRENTRKLTILRKLFKEEAVVLECVMEKTEQELILDRWTRTWIYDWTLAVCYEQLASIRGKYQTLPGPGGLNLNGAELAQKAEVMKTELLRQINDFEVGNLVEWGCSMLLLG